MGHARREFLGRSIALAGAAALGAAPALNAAASAAPPKRKTRNPIGVSTYSFWGFNGVAASVDLNSLNLLGHSSASNPIIDLTDLEPVVDTWLSPSGGPSRSAHTAGAWVAANIALLTITIALLVATAFVLRRHDGG